MSAGGAHAPQEKPLLDRLRAVLPGGLKLEVTADGFYRVKTGAPDFREIARRPRRVVEKWRTPEQTLLFVIDWELRKKGSK